MTAVGFSILKFKSSPVLSAYAIILSHYFNCQSDMIIMMAIIEVCEGKIDTFFLYDKRKEREVIKKFNHLIIPNSDHLTILNIYKNYNEREYINKKIFSTIEDRIKQLSMYAESIPENKYEQMNEKYLKLKPKKSKNTNDNLINVLSIAFSYNLLKKNVGSFYKSKNFPENSRAPLEFSFLMPKVNAKSKYAICNSLNNVFGNKNFSCITIVNKPSS